MIGKTKLFALWASTAVIVSTAVILKRKYNDKMSGVIGDIKSIGNNDITVKVHQFMNKDDIDIKFRVTPFTQLVTKDNRKVYGNARNLEVGERVIVEYHNDNKNSDRSIKAVTITSWPDLL